jgi:hypothetical protein
MSDCAAVKTPDLDSMSKRFGSLGFKGSTQEKWPSEIFRFGYKKAANGKMVPDRVGSGVFVLH